MKAKVFVTLKPGVLDPQGKAIHHSLESHGYKNINELRQGKYFEFEFVDGVTADDARTALQKIGKEVLANPVIEDYRIEVAD